MILLIPQKEAYAAEYHVKTHLELLGAISLYGTTNNVIYLDNDIDATTSATFSTAKQVTIDGQGHAIRGDGINDSFIHFNLNGTGNNIVLRNLVMEGLVNNGINGGSGATRSYGGGAILMRRGTLTIENCAFIGNKCFNANAATGNGGGAIRVGSNNTTLTITNSTFYGNESNSGGGAIWLGTFANSAVTGAIRNCTVVGNSATGGAGIVFTGNTSSSYTVSNSIIAGNTATDTSFGKDFHVLLNSSTSITSINTVFTDEGFNLLGDVKGTYSTSISSPNYIGDLAINPETELDVDVSGFLAGGAPKVNEWGTPTIALLPLADSPAVDKIDVASAPEKDQRGFERYNSADIGAYELQAPEIFVGAQTGELRAGTAGSATFDVSAMNIAPGIPIFLINVNGAEGISLADAETGYDEIVTITINTTAATPVGSHPLKIEIGGVESEIFNLAVEQPAASGGSSGGGCDAGFGAVGAALLAAAFFLARLARKGRKNPENAG
jgi:hypothetical protein